MTENLPAVKPIETMKIMLSKDSVKEQFENSLKENSSLFVSSLIDLYGSDSHLQNCNAGLVIKEALKAATLKLPINKSLGCAWIIPYKKGNDLIPQFQIGYKGYIQLAIRTKQYKYINADCLYEGEQINFDRLSGKMEIVGSQESDKVIGYFAYFETLEGYKKAISWDVERMTMHAKTYSKSYGSKYSPWTTEGNKMGIKTMLKTLLSKWGVMSIENDSRLMAKAFENDSDDMSFDKQKQIEADQFANAEVIDTKPVDNKKEEKQKNKENKPGF